MTPEPELPVLLQDAKVERVMGFLEVPTATTERDLSVEVRSLHRIVTHIAFQVSYAGTLTGRRA